MSSGFRVSETVSTNSDRFRIGTKVVSVAFFGYDRAVGDTLAFEIASSLSAAQYLGAWPSMTGFSTDN